MSEFKTTVWMPWSDVNDQRQFDAIDFAALITLWKLRQRKLAKLCLGCGPKEVPRNSDGVTVAGLAPIS